MRASVARLLRRAASAAAGLGGWALAGAALTAPAAAQQLDYALSIQSATGSYLFTERTTSLALLNGLSLAVGRLRISATLPMLYQNSTAVTYVGGVPIPTGGPDAAAVRQHLPGTRVPMGPIGTGMGGGGRSSAMAPMLALAAEAAEGEQTAQVAQMVAEPADFQMDVGDALLQAGIDLHRGLGAVRGLSVSALAKAPLADAESGVGTGEWDYGAGLSLELGAGRTFVLADASYWVVGDLPDLPLRNTLWYAASVGRSLGTGAWSVLGSVTGGTAIIESAEAPLSVGLGLGYTPEGTRSFNVGVSFGLTESSPDVSSYVGWRIALGRRTR